MHFELHQAPLLKLLTHYIIYEEPNQPDTAEECVQQTYSLEETCHNPTTAQSCNDQ